MERLGNNVWLGITNTIYTIHSVNTPEKMADMVLRELRWLIPFDRAMFFFTSREMPDSAMMEEPVCINFDKEYIDMFVQNHRRYDCTMGLKVGGNSIVYRESDVVDPQFWQQSSFYREFCKPNNIAYILQVVLCCNNSYCGNILLFRNNNSINAVDFSDKDMFIMNLLKEHLSLGIARLQGIENVDVKKENSNVETITWEEYEDEKLTVQECALKYHLTGREEQILSMILDGSSTESICMDLYITLNTLKKHIFNMYKKLGVNSRTQLFKLVKEKSYETLV